MASDEQPFSDLEATLKRAAAALREAQVPFLLGGSLASWARGGPETRHDLDFIVKRDDAERALKALEEAGMRPERPAEDWLLKAYDGDVLIDVIYEPATGPVTDETFERADEIEVLSTRMRLMALEDIMVTKLVALDETHLDYSGALDVARSLREQIDWSEVRERTRDSPYARAFFTLVEELGIVARDAVGYS